MMLLPIKVACGAVVITILIASVTNIAVAFCFWFFPWISLSIFLSSEVSFSLWWWIFHSPSLASQPDIHAPKHHDPEKAFSRFEALAKTSRLLAHKSYRKTGAISEEPPPVDIKRFLSWWFSGVDFSSVKRGNVAELFAYAFHYKTIAMMEQDGLGHLPMQMVERLEKATGNSLSLGYQEGLKPMFHLWEPLRCHPRPLTFYLLMELLSLWAHAVLVLVMRYKVHNMPKLVSTPSLACTSQEIPLAKLERVESSDVANANRRTPMPPKGGLIRGSTDRPFSLGVYTFGSPEGGWGSRPASGGLRAEGIKQRPQVVDCRDDHDMQPSRASSSPLHNAGLQHDEASSLLSLPPTARASKQKDSVGLCISSSSGVTSLATAGSSSCREPPILMLHGVGFGLMSYLPLAARLASTGRPVICMKIRHISMQLTRYIPMACEVAEDVIQVIDSLGVEQVSVVAHSYGTFVASVLAQRHGHRLHSACLIDPVCFGVFMPNLLGNFVYRHSHQLKGTGPMDWLMCFISRDVHVASTFGRRFYWSDVNLWADDLPKKCLVVLSGRDDLIHVEEVRCVINCCTSARLLYHPDHMHAGCLLDAKWQDKIVSEIVDLLGANKKH
ncbi:hypothetical protein CEUSTIGMA_g12445.t1 [Chlamydomonas eustigma]|uniref:AB hydrolase-1 domain-containing protein n=1 Tax=Chlamydomonas eustigma TaxID=1157962 RepID=A0A250XPN0_9CHLO|nr:hypothetical protein CEUSTIGMA_g12445.t1 [Chlamydomonas eustigma]|eukprot:GAX85025.1 hypothetical protein CEUSTIGMA_g12445.t1 [Chlamydomonas eustigma]